MSSCVCVRLSCVQQAGAFLDPAKAPAILRSINYKTILAFTKKSTEFVRELCTQKQRGAGARGNQDRVLLPKPMTRISQALTSEKLRRFVTSLSLSCHECDSLPANGID